VAIGHKEGGYDKIVCTMVELLVGFFVAIIKYLRRWAMKLIYSKEHIDKLILISVTDEPELSVSRNRISPFSLEVSNSAPCDITMDATVTLVATDGTDLAFTVKEPVQTIAKSKSKSFSIRPLEVLKNGQQKVAGIRSKSMTALDYMDAALSIKAVVKTSIHDEILVTRDLRLRIKTTN
jgi:hypothetical protein